MYNIPQLKTTNSKLFSLSDKNVSLKNEKESENVRRVTKDGNFLPLCFLFGGWGGKKTKAGGKDYKGKRLFNKGSKIKVPIVFIHSPILLKPTNRNTGKQ